MDVATGALMVERPKILLLEDDPGVRRSLQLLLQAQGLDVRAYASGVSLLADETTAGAICLVADYRLEDLDGIAVLSRLRAKHWDGPAILITAFPTEALRRRALVAGFAVVMEKPLRPRALTETLSRMVSRTKGEA
ncbi:response regulator [Sphingobium boeckii]|uniref:FixJ family two-component response regulator n=1 Tax=Sphingobium boeckii TaxID=1082345 RepID=A0A7W9AJK9_9SPHN|nr:response regulator [Sphingobium boeckii]MBB5686656.1 FixJ family two-component response regulator [Sphingobium boeckii]